MASSALVKEEPHSPVNDPANNILSDLFAPTTPSETGVTGAPVTNLNFNVKEEPLEHLSTESITTNPIIRTIYSRPRYFFGLFEKIG